MKNRFTSLLFIITLFLLFDACKRQTVSPSVFSLTVKQCNQPKLAFWPRDLSVDVYYFPPETNRDEAWEQISQERDTPSETVELKPADFDTDGNFRLKLKPDQVVILFLYANGTPNLNADSQLETTHGRSGEICVRYNY